MYSKISETLKSLDTLSISENRLRKLHDLVNLLSAELNLNNKLQLNFICSHNSRRSHVAQVWAYTIANYFNIPVESYSGGTEATAVYPMVIQTLQNQGFQIEGLTNSENSIYFFKNDKNAAPLVLFSKRFEHQINPTDNFIAIMTCSHADKNCPVVLGAKSRFALTYEDPKLFDDTDLKELKYRERSLEIAAELYVVFKELSKV